jgi:aminomethyltransferase
MLKRTPLFASHQKLGGRLIEFGGWEMPVQYTSIMDEHQTVRTAAGVFDISHMGEVLVKGAAAREFLNGLLTNDLAKISGGQGQYTLMCNETGGVVDDLYAYCLGGNDYLLVINASRIDADVAWMQQRLAAFAKKADVQLENASDRFGAIAVQGPRVVEFIDECITGPATGGKAVTALSQLKKNEVAVFQFQGVTVYTARTGYTGEDGFEVIAPADKIEAVWDKVLQCGQKAGIKPAGLGARDTLRTEVCYPLYGHELDEQTTPIEAGVGFFVALDKGDFMGREVLAGQKAGGVQKKCVAFKMTDKSAPPRPHYPIWSAGNGGTVIGEVVSGTQSPSLGIGIGMGYVTPAEAKAGTTIEIEIRGKRFAAMVVAKPIYRKPAG